MDTNNAAKKVRVRIPPSPTGFMHVGTARMALFNYIFAKQNGGDIVLRLEDTDKERSTKEFADDILDGIKWLGLSWDEGPFYQSQRGDIYKKYLQKLLAEDKAYWCFCSQERFGSGKTISNVARRSPDLYGQMFPYGPRSSRKSDPAGEAGGYSFSYSAQKNVF